jgi:hypothetical protein
MPANISVVLISGLSLATCAWVQECMMWFMSMYRLSTGRWSLLLPPFLFSDGLHICG